MLAGSKKNHGTDACRLKEHTCGFSCVLYRENSKNLVRTEGTFANLLAVIAIPLCSEDTIFIQNKDKVKKFDEVYQILPPVFRVKWS